MLGSDGVLDFKAWVNGLGVQTWGLQDFWGRGERQRERERQAGFTLRELAVRMTRFWRVRKLLDHKVTKPTLGCASAGV